MKLSYREQLYERRNTLVNSYGNGSYRDGLVRQAIEKIDAEIAALPPNPDRGLVEGEQ